MTAVATDIRCGACGERLEPVPDVWGAFRCADRNCNRYGRFITIKPTQTTFQRKKWRQTRKGKTA